ncbi:hypothetical protein [Kineococcus sp. SYSU DK006]|uniref:MmyB family transcriptional regulator n=1 Tax=Kineococcus sp. SYSU DK006 TaxID=3383127 RepID=UPI003D7DB05A
MCAEPPHPPSASAALNRALDVVGADPRWQRLHAPLGEVGNLAHAVFLEPAAGWFFLDHEQVQVAVVALLRGGDPRAAGSAGRPGARGAAEPTTGSVERWGSVVEDLRTRSPQFRRLWSGLHVRYRTRTSCPVHHPDLGAITVDRFVSRAADGSWLERVQAPADSPAAQVMALLDLI